MSPNRVVTLHRWQIVAAFLALVASSVLVALWNDYRIDQAGDRISRNTASAADLQHASEELEKVTEKLQANEKTANQAAVDNCYSRITQLPSLHKLLLSIRTTLPDDPEARAAIDDYITLTAANTPTVGECNRLAATLGVKAQVR